MPEPKTWSLLSELYTIEAAIDGARILADVVAEDRARDQNDERIAPTTVSAVLSLVSLRLRDVTRVMRGETDPERLWGEHNASASKAEQLDVVFRSQQTNLSK